MDKKNEQGQYQKRFICAVPHTFLYYYENEYSENPRGIIDLELYMKLSIEDDFKLLKMATMDENCQRYHNFSFFHFNLIDID